jgi:outer membrane protein assembly factor BamE (lipoprotein component of BamABCDE complex)
LKFEIEFWTFDDETVDVKIVYEPEVEKEIGLTLDDNRLAKVRLGKTKAKVLKILGALVDVEHR